MTTRSTPLGLVDGTANEWVCPTKNGGWLYGGCGASGQKSLWWSVDSINWLPMDNQTANARNYRIYSTGVGIISEIGANFVTSQGQLIQGFSAVTDGVMAVPSKCSLDQCIRSPITNTLMRAMSNVSTATATSFGVLARSTDDGMTWTIVYSRQSGTSQGCALNGVRWVHDRFIAVGANGKISVSTNDGLTFTDITPTGFSTNSTYDAIYFAGNYFVIGSGTNNCAVASDGLTFVGCIAGSGTLMQAAASGTTLIFKPDSTSLFWSTTGNVGSWTTQTGVGINILYDGTQFVSSSLSNGAVLVVYVNPTGQGAWTVKAQAASMLAACDVGIQGRLMQFFCGAYYLMAEPQGLWNSSVMQLVLKSTDLCNWSPIIAVPNNDSQMGGAIDNLSTRLDIRTTYNDPVMSVYNAATPTYIGTKEEITINGAVAYVRLA